MSSSALGLNIPEPLIGRADDRMSGVMSAIGTKRTLPSALHMSAFDPKPTLLFFATTPHQRGVSYKGLGPPVASRR